VNNTHVKTELSEIDSILADKDTAPVFETSNIRNSKE
jgi:hypothetical protein